MKKNDDYLEAIFDPEFDIEEFCDCEATEGRMCIARFLYVMYTFSLLSEDSRKFIIAYGEKMLEFEKKK
ncbi:MAG: hypothetical protein Q4B70_15800 [Lachnospiraceae bacterium]|nr:hypothetical protein [Lachnospiraceae bacterium]